MAPSAQPQAEPSREGAVLAADLERENRAMRRLVAAVQELSLLQ